ncbi:hypothetical protein BS78_01G234100 [Paspalum vaginatum]|nr:hypothetical protein BS78_01G234100 [Paspalum vaginatum]
MSGIKNGHEIYEIENKLGFRSRSSPPPESVRIDVFYLPHAGQFICRRFDLRAVPVVCLRVDQGQGYCRSCCPCSRSVLRTRNKGRNRSAAWEKSTNLLWLLRVRRRRCCGLLLRT